jgi:hypothetical protein
MHADRMVARPAFGGEHGANGSWIRGIGPQAIDSLGGKGDEATGAQHDRRSIDRISGW